MSYIYLLHNWLVVEHKLNKFYIKWKSFLTFWNVIYLSKLLNVHNFLHVQFYIYLFMLFWFGFLFWSHNNKNSILDSHPNPNGMSLSHIWLFVPNEDHTYFLEKRFLFYACFCFHYPIVCIYTEPLRTTSFTNDFFIFTKVYFWHCSWLVLFLSFYISKFLFWPLMFDSILYLTFYVFKFIYEWQKEKKNWILKANIGRPQIEGPLVIEIN